MQLLLNIYIIFSGSGAQDHLKSIDPGVWILSKATQAKTPPVIADDNFFQTCHSLVLQQFNIDLFRDVSLSNCLRVYTYLRDTVEPATSTEVFIVKGC